MHDMTMTTPPPSAPSRFLLLGILIMSQLYEVQCDADARETTEAVTAIDDLLERPQGVVGSGINNGDAPEPLEDDVAGEAFWGRQQQ